MINEGGRWGCQRVVLGVCDLSKKGEKKNPAEFEADERENRIASNLTHLIIFSAHFSDLFFLAI